MPAGTGLTTFETDLESRIRERVTLAVVMTPEEARVQRSIESACEANRRPCAVWDSAEGYAGSRHGPDGAPIDPYSALEQADRLPEGTVIVLKDFHEYWGQHRVKRKLRNLAARFLHHRKTIVITCPGGRVPDELQDDAVVIDFPLPDEATLSEVLGSLEQAAGVQSVLDGLGRQMLVREALGLSVAQARRAFSRALVTRGRFDHHAIEDVKVEKKQIIRGCEALEYFPVDQTEDAVGGMESLKGWLRLQIRAFSPEARAFGLPAPKGLLLVGIPGVGKSLTVKMVAGLFHLPLLRLDVGAMFAGLVGESEERTRQALRVASAVAPCVLWVDELEKAFASGGHDGGTSSRVLGTFLTWLQEKTAPCFVVATANDIGKLPPELLRKGRWDDLFFLDLPTEAERREILSIHLSRRGRPVAAFDVDRLATASAGFVGSELEQAVIDALRVAFNRGDDVSTADIAAAIATMVPLCVSHREVVQDLRRWLLEGRARSASFPEPEAAEREFVDLEATGRVVPLRRPRPER